MKIVEPDYDILTPISEGGIEELKKIELAARTCYKSEDKISPDGSSAKKMVAGLIKSGHHAMLEHGSLSVRFLVDRGVSHEIVRHRLASYAQESTRYCNYTKGKFGSELTFIRPPFGVEDQDGLPIGLYEIWMNAMQDAEMAYNLMIQNGAKPEEARSVLPNSLKTEVVMTANYREWRHFFTLRCAHDAHPQIRQVACPLLDELHGLIPVIFDDVHYRMSAEPGFKEIVDWQNKLKNGLDI